MLDLFSGHDSNKKIQFVWNEICRSKLSARQPEAGRKKPFICFPETKGFVFAADKLILATVCLSDCQ